MKTHDNRVLFSKALLKAATCLFLTVGAGMSPVFALPGTAESMKMEITQQTVTVSGVVKDRKGEPIIGANIMEKGTTNGTITDFDGKYRLNVKGSQSVLVISYIGYKTQEFEVKNNRKIDVTLQEDTEVMDEVVVIGYGTQRKGDVTSAVASVKAEDFTVGKIGDAADLIKGKVAGLSIAKGSGDPNATSTIRLRGVISVNGSTTPLILIDGVEGDLSTVAPENIASIDVLKDASAAAIYGTRGANGVILITTQNGKRESHTTASYSGYVSASQFGKKLEFMTAEDIRAGKTNFTDKGYDTDWLDAVSRTGFTHNHNFNITGGSKQTTYSADVTYRKEDGVIMNTYSEDIRMRFDVSHWMLNDMLKVNLNMVKKWHKNSATNATATDQSNIYRQAIMRNPTAPIYNEDGSYNEDFNVNYYYNPVGMLEERLGNYTYEETRATGNVTFEPVKGWQTNLMVATSRFNAHDKGYNTTDYFSNQLNEWTGYAYHTQDETRTDNLELTSKYDLNVGKHRMNALVGYSYQYYTYERFYANNYNFPTDFYQWHNLGLGQALKDGKAGMGSDKNENTLIGFFARVSYAFDNKYNLLVSVRQEGSSKFGDNNKWGTFPSASLGWTISNEGFMEGITWLNNLKLRAGFGITGVIPNDPYMSLTRYNYGSSYYYDKGTWKPGLEVASNPNPDLKWEKTLQWDAGVDVSVLNQRIDLSLDYYYKKTSDLLLEAPIPGTSGLNTIMRNIGSVQNQGFELTLNTHNIQTDNFNWMSTVLFNVNRNKILNLGENDEDIYPKPRHAQGDMLILRVGEPVGSLWGLRRLGTWGEDEAAEAAKYNRLPGDVKYEDLNGDGKINSEDNTIIGCTSPDWTMTISNTFLYKNFDFSFDLRFVFGNDVVNCATHNAEDRSGVANGFKSNLNAWTPQNQHTMVAQRRPMKSYYDSYPDSHWMQNGSFVRGQNFVLGYTFSKSLLQKIKLQDLRIYASAQNLFCITKYKGYDPEVTTYEDAAFGQGIDDFSEPKARTFTFGLNVKF